MSGGYVLHHSSCWCIEQVAQEITTVCRYRNSLQEILDTAQSVIDWYDHATTTEKYEDAKRSGITIVDMHTIQRLAREALDGTAKSP